MTRFGMFSVAGNAMIQGRNEGPSGNAGTATAGLAVAGYAPGNVTCTEEWDGTNWSAGGAKIIAVRGNATTGTQNAAIDTTGYAASPSAATENYNGSAYDGLQAMKIANACYDSSNSNKFVFIL